MSSYCKTVSTNPVKYECTHLEEKGNKCHNYEDCKLSLGCGVTSGVDPTCVELFSLNDGDKSTVASLCKSNHIYTDATLGSICVSSSIKDAKCNDAHKCRIKYTYNGKEEEVDETCRQNYNGEYTCTLQSDSQQYKDYYETFQKEMKKTY